MGERIYRLTIVRDDGRTNTTDFIGYHAEGAADHFYNEACLYKHNVYVRTTVISSTGQIEDVRGIWTRLEREEVSGTEG